MSQFSKIIHTRAGNAGAAPSAVDLDYGELAINYADGILFYKTSANLVKAISVAGTEETLSSHIANSNNPHNVTKASVGLGNVNNTSDANKPLSAAAISSNLGFDSRLNTIEGSGVGSISKTAVDAANYTDAEVNFLRSGMENLIVATTASLNNEIEAVQDSIPVATSQLTNDANFIKLNNISVGAETAASGNGAITYNNTTGVLTYTPPIIPGTSDLIKLTNLSVGAETSPSGNGAISYNNTTGVFRYTPPVQPTFSDRAEIDKSRGGAITLTTTPYQVDLTDFMIMVDDDTVGGDVTINLLPAADYGSGFVLDVKKLGTTGSVLIVADGAETLDGLATLTIRDPRETLRFVSDGTNWQILSPHVVNGWANYEDLASKTPFVIAGTRTKLTIDGLGSATNKDFLPAAVTDLWDSVNNKIVPAKLGDSYTIRLDFTVTPGGLNDSADISLDIGDENASPVESIPAGHQTIKFAKAGATDFSLAFPIFSLQTFMENGGKFFVNTPDTLTFSNIALFIRRDYSALY